MSKILLVEDNEMNCDMLSRRLRRRGFDVSIAMNGREGVEKAKTEKPDLILMDLNLPEIDGRQATGLLKKDQETCHIPIIALTAHAMVTDRDKAIRAGCDEFATKPIDFDGLVAKINGLLTRTTSTV